MFIAIPFMQKNKTCFFFPKRNHLYVYYLLKVMHVHKNLQVYNFFFLITKL